MATKKKDSKGSGSSNPLKSAISDLAGALVKLNSIKYSEHEQSKVISHNRAIANVSMAISNLNTI